MDAGLQDRVALVTGAARGIGKAIADMLTAAGARVAVLDRVQPSDSGQLEIVADLTIAEQVSAAIAQVETHLGAVDILVNNAGVNANFDAVTMTEDEWQFVFDTDVRGAWLCAREVLPGMLSTGSGSIVNVTSVHARASLEGFFPYGAAKAALEGMTRSLALDYGPRGVRVNAVAPGYTRTTLVQEWLQSQGSEGTTAEQIDRVHPLRRIAEPSEVAAAVCFLAGDHASAITGQTIVVDCGLTARFAT